MISGDKLEVPRTYPGRFGNTVSRHPDLPRPHARGISDRATNDRPPLGNRAHITHLSLHLSSSVDIELHPTGLYLRTECR